MASPTIRLNKRMAELGLSSRREADAWIAAGWVRVNGQPAVIGQPVSPDDRIEVLKSAREVKEQQVTILLNKPIGYVSGQAEDGHEDAAVLVQAHTRWREDRSDVKFFPAHAPTTAPCARPVYARPARESVV